MLCCMHTIENQKNMQPMNNGVPPLKFQLSPFQVTLLVTTDTPGTDRRLDMKLAAQPNTVLTYVRKQFHAVLSSRLTDPSRSMAVANALSFIFSYLDNQLPRAGAARRLEFIVRPSCFATQQGDNHRTQCQSLELWISIT